MCRDKKILRLAYSSLISVDNREIKIAFTANVRFAFIFSRKKTTKKQKQKQTNKIHEYIDEESAN